MKILQVAYPFEPVSTASAGGTEQILALLDRELTALGHKSVVLARAGSRVAGRLVPSAPANADFETSCRAHETALKRLLAREHFDLIHDQGSGIRHWPGGPPVLSTLHLTRSLLGEAPSLGPGRHYNLVSRSQRAQYADHDAARDWPVIPNGIDLHRFRPGGRRADFALCIGRVCPEKGFHHALAATRAAGLPLVIAGKVYRFDSHVRYFDTAIRPHLGLGVTFIDSPTAALKRELLRRARCVLIPSEVEETSSLVAMEAAACDTPVICFRRGALPEVVVDGQTGFVVEDGAAMAHALARLGEIDGNACRRHAQQHFSSQRLALDYLSLYQALAN